MACTSCSNGFYLNNGQCISVCNLTSYYNTVSLICTLCPSLCITCNSKGCLTCIKNYFLQNQVCVNNCSDGTYLYH